MPQEIVSLLIILATILFFIRFKSKSIYWLPLYCFVIDGCYLFFQDYKYIHYTRSIFFTFLTFYVLRNKRFKDDFGIFLFLAFQLFTLFYSTNIYYNLKFIHLGSVSLFMLPIGYSFFKKRSQIKILNKCLYCVVVFWAIYVLFSTVFKLGGTVSEKFGTFFYYGAFATTGGLSSIVFVLIILPFFIEDIRKISQKVLVIIGASFILMTLIIALKRMSLIVLILGYLIFFLRSPLKKRHRFIVLILVIAGILLSFSSFYSGEIEQRVEERGEWRFRSDFYLREARYYESKQITEDILKFKSVSTSLFGKGYGSQTFEVEKIGERDIHVEFNFYLQVSGLIGLLLYLNIYYKTVRLFWKYKKRILRKKNIKIISIIFINLLILFLLAHFAGGVSRVTFRSIVFLYLGATLGVFRNAALHQENQDEILLVK